MVAKKVLESTSSATPRHGEIPELSDVRIALGIEGDEAHAEIGSARVDGDDLPPSGDLAVGLKVGRDHEKAAAGPGKAAIHLLGEGVAERFHLHLIAVHVIGTEKFDGLAPSGLHRRPPSQPIMNCLRYRRSVRLRPSGNRGRPRRPGPPPRCRRGLVAHIGEGRNKAAPVDAAQAGKLGLMELEGGRQDADVGKAIKVDLRRP